MVDLPAIFDGFSRWAAFIREYRSIDLEAYPAATAFGAVLAGLVLCLWGARLLRAVYILSFMSLGAALGIRVARQMDVDVLIGLVLGAGVLALVGHLMFRLWVGVTAGLVGLLAVVAVGAPWIESEARQYADRLLESATGQRVFAAVVEAEVAPARGPALPTIDESRLTLSAAAGRLGAFLWAERSNELWRVVLLAVIAGLLGLVLGLVIPRWVMVVGTSTVGAVLVVCGAMSLMARHWPAGLEWTEARPLWVPIAAGGLLLLSVLRQGLRRTAVAVPLPVAAVTPAKPAGG